MSSLIRACVALGHNIQIWKHLWVSTDCYHPFLLNFLSYMDSCKDQLILQHTTPLIPTYPHVASHWSDWHVHNTANNPDCSEPTRIWHSMARICRAWPRSMPWAVLYDIIDQRMSRYSQVVDVISIDRIKYKNQAPHDQQPHDHILYQSTTKASIAACIAIGPLAFNTFDWSV